MPERPENLVLAQLQGIRRELKTVLENQARHQELIGRLITKVTELETDLSRIENRLINRDNDVLTIMRRLDEMGAPAD